MNRSLGRQVKSVSTTILANVTRAGQAFHSAPYPKIQK
ncbi:hypothetical protein FRUB_08529 [Fimbriiglobus ruber]|uniref:Uncharacterized protein n=1 Tax=Fimbriiglobus ruber TaxID=1908690 RepID=A0A225DF47_9BACT|nr:hypothetical protein FRUB_08529 [Fimbriiglobus ruber]